jgi:hypothetical protein
MSEPIKTVEEAVAALGPLPESQESGHGPLWSLLDWSFWGAGMGDIFREALADRMVAAIPAQGVEHAEAIMAEFIRRRQIEKTGVTVYQEQRDELERLRARVAELEALATADRAEILAEAELLPKADVVAWLVKKAREETPVWLLASKVDRGAIRPDNLRMVPADFFEPGHTYRNGLYTYRCVGVGPHPTTSETRAVGWLTHADRQAPEVWAMDPDDWTLGGWSEGGAADA